MVLGAGDGYDAAMTQDPEPTEVAEVVQAAVDSTATAYTRDAGLDVEERLRSELAGRGVDLDDEAWLAEAASGIRAGHSLRIDPDAD